MKKILLLLFAAVCLCSCDDEKQQSITPTYETIELSPNPCQIGDTVTAVVTYKNKGSYWYYTQFKFTMGERTLYSFKRTDTYWWQEDNAKCKFVVTERPGKHTVTFNCQYGLTAGYTLYEMGPTISNTLIVEGEEDEE